MAEVRVSDPEADEPGESIHLPGPSYQPVVVAFGVTLAVVGVVLFPVLAVIGVVITVITVVRWVRDTRREISELPLEH
jgi:Flp pilus assembly protein TadB